MSYDYFIFRVFEHPVPLATANPAQTPKCCQPGNKKVELMQSCSFSWLHKLWYSFTSVDHEIKGLGQRLPGLCKAEQTRIELNSEYQSSQGQSKDRKIVGSIDTKCFPKEIPDLTPLPQSCPGDTAKRLKNVWTLTNANVNNVVIRSL